MEAIIKKSPDKVSLKTLLAYSIGFAPSAVLCYNAFYIYYMYFVTDIAHISAIAAGFITLIAIVWDSISDPIIAFMSDNCRWKSGRRIPFMGIGVIAMTSSLVAIFTVIDVSETGRVIYFIVTTLIFWTGATMWDIPHNALGSELVSKQSEREKLRIGTTIVDGIGLIFLAYVIPNLTDALIRSTGNEPKSWQYTMIIIGGIALIIGLAVCAVLKNKEPKIDWAKYDELHKGETKVKLLTTIKEIFQLKPYKFLVGIVISVNLGNVLMQSSIVYFMTYVSGFTPAQQSVVLVVQYATHLICGLIIGGGLQKRFGSRKIFISGLLLAILGTILFPNFFDVTSILIMCLYVIFLSIGVRVLWLYCYIYAYGIAMLDDIKNQKHREGNIVGYMSLGLKSGSAFATLLIGIVLQISGYDGTLAIQSASALRGIHILIGILPVIFLGFGLILLIKYPMRDKDVTIIEEQIVKRDAGLPYSTLEIEHLM